jgi:hypothetical protein
LDVKRDEDDLPDVGGSAWAAAPSAGIVLTPPPTAGSSPTGRQDGDGAFDAGADLRVGPVDALLRHDPRAVGGPPYSSGMSEPSLRLSNSPGPAGRILGAVVGAVFVAGGTFFAVLAVAGERFFETFGGVDRCAEPGGVTGMPADGFPPDIDDCSGWLPPHLGPVGWVGLVLGGGFALLGLFLILRCLRAAAWLDGTTLRVRGALRSRVVDLAVADITLGTVTYTDDDHRSRRVPMLLARDAASGRRVKLPLSGAGVDRLPPAELRALADALTTGRPSAPADTWQAASQLRQTADNPLNLPMR